MLGYCIVVHVLLSPSDMCQSEAPNESLRLSDLYDCLPTTPTTPILADQSTQHAFWLYADHSNNSTASTIRLLRGEQARSRPTAAVLARFLI
jgi:hypothetical protein